MADGTPQDLQANTGMNIVEVMAKHPSKTQAILARMPELASVTQLGIRLRALLPQDIEDPLELVQRVLRSNDIDAEIRIATASLEDVFVAATLKPERVAA